MKVRSSQRCRSTVKVSLVPGRDIATIFFATHHKGPPTGLGPRVGPSRPYQLSGQIILTATLPDEAAKRRHLGCRRRLWVAMPVFSWERLALTLPIYGAESCCLIARSIHSSREIPVRPAACSTWLSRPGGKGVWTRTSTSSASDGT